MTEAVQIALIASAGPTAIGLLNIAHQVMVARKVAEMGVNIQKVETATNHIHDALVASTAMASHAEGVRDEKIRVAIEQNVPVNAAVTPPASPPVLPSH